MVERRMTNQNSWIEAMKKEWAKPDYAKMKLVDTVYGDDQDDKSYREMQALVKTHPNLKGVISPTTIGIRASAKAIMQSTDGVQRRMRFVLFVLTGVLSGLAGALLTARIGSTRPNIALGWELEIVTMVVLGGVSIAGGAGSIPGVVVAVLVLGLTTFGLTLLNVPGIVINVILGLLLIAAIALPIVVRRLIAGRG